MNTNRRTILKGMALSPLAMNENCFQTQKDKKILESNIPENLRILFQGDSITDSNRDQANNFPNEVHAMGYGYVYQIAFQLLGRHPEKKIKIYNRGIAGNRTKDLIKRWKEDCLHLNPNVLSILIGTNDYIQSLTKKETIAAKEFAENMQYLFERTLQSYKNVQFIIGEPFVIRGGTKINKDWERIAVYQEITKSLASNYGATYIPYQSIFDKALKEAPVEYWGPDGIHPTMAGYYLMSNAWLQAFHELFE